MKLCPCGSGHARRDLVDRQGIFCTFVCDKCERQKRNSFNPAIFDGPYPDDEPVEAESYYGQDDDEQPETFW
jgi:hypothetical protein